MTRDTRNPDPGRSALPGTPDGSVVTTSTCRVPLEALGRRGPLPPVLRAGDLVEVEVTRPGYAFEDGAIEGRIAEGRCATVPVRGGLRLIAAVGHRDAADEYVARLPRRLGPPLHLCAPCGLVSRVEGNAVQRPPTEVRLLAAVVDAEGRVLRTRAYPLAAPPAPPRPRSGLIAFVADRMNAGKSTAVLACLRALGRAGHRVAAGKVTGTARLRGLLQAREAGACAAEDFSSLGYPSTCLVPGPALQRLLVDLHAYLDASADGGSVLLELADGWGQRENRALLESGYLGRNGARTVLCLSGLGDPWQQVLDFQGELGVAVTAVSGRACADGRVRRELLDRGVACFDARTADEGALAECLLGQRDAPAPDLAPRLAGLDDTAPEVA